MSKNQLETLNQNSSISQVTELELLMLNSAPLSFLDNGSNDILYSSDESSSIQDLYKNYSEETATNQKAASSKNTQNNRRQLKTSSRADHNAAERARRINLNAKFCSLAKALPNIPRYVKPSKYQIVEKSLEFVHISTWREEEYRRQISQLQKENKTLLKLLSQAQSVRATNIPSTAEAQPRENMLSVRDIVANQSSSPHVGLPTPDGTPYCTGRRLSEEELFANYCNTSNEARAVDRSEEEAIGHSPYLFDHLDKEANDLPSKKLDFDELSRSTQSLLVPQTYSSLAEDPLLDVLLYEPSHTTADYHKKRDFSKLDSSLGGAINATSFLYAL